MSRGKTYQSSTYMWNADDFIARGATGQVYMGYNKRSGEKVAVKMFTNQAEYGAMQREMMAVRQIPKHENIVQCLEIDEKENTERTSIIVMEFCNGGSLYEVIDTPQNAYGLGEEQFKLVVLHVSRGLCHLKKLKFAHRDIKPGNILRVRDFDGRYAYKLTDFGTARQLEVDEKFTSLHGTEEYLYPAMYERALINPRVKAHFVDKIDLWSVGATFFHVATGRLPFQPYLKRNDRQKMFQITKFKPPNVILGWQTTLNGDTFYSESLPPDSVISNGLKSVITPVLAGLLENDYEKMWNFDRFFDYVELINSLKVIDVFCVSKCVLIKVYMKPNSKDPIDLFKKTIAKQTDLSQQHMEFYHENIPLKRPKAGQPYSFPSTTPDSPVTVFGGPPQPSSRLDRPHLPDIPHDNPTGSLTDDLRYAKDCCKAVWAYMRAAEYLARTYKLMQQAANCLSQMLHQEYINLREKTDKVQEMYDHALRQLDAHINGLQYEAGILQAIGSNDAVAMELQKIQDDVSHKRQEYKRLKTERGDNLNFESFFSQVEKLLEGGSCAAELESTVFDESMKKIQSYVEGIDELFKVFQREKKTKIGSDVFGKQVNRIRKEEINRRMHKAKEEIVRMTEARSQVYSKLFEILAKCISLREELKHGESTLSNIVGNLQSLNKRLEEWLPSHHQSMQSVYQRLVGPHQQGRQGNVPAHGSMGSSSVGSSGIGSSYSSMAPQEVNMLLSNIISKARNSTQLAEQQKEYLEKNLTH